jgi:glycosyltransferase involved in cell wall biosynthesis
LKFHIALSLPLDLHQLSQEIQAGKRPRFAMLELSRSLGAQLHYPRDLSITWADRINAKIMGQPEHWALARHLAHQLGEEDTIFCMGEDVGLPIASACRALPPRSQGYPKVVVFVVNLNRPRGKLALRSLKVRTGVDLWMGFSSTQIQFLQEYLDLVPAQLMLLGDQTDIEFFTPAPVQVAKQRPLIASGGMEQRDYITLAAAVADLDVDVRVCAFSRNAQQHPKTFPKVVPANMTYAYYDWPDLRQLYRDADVVSISVYPNTYSAGFTTLLEALACRRPVVITQSAGPIQELINAGCVLGVPAQSPAALRSALQFLIAHPEAAKAQAERGYQFVLQRYSSERYLKKLEATLKEMAHASVNDQVLV